MSSTIARPTAEQAHLQGLLKKIHDRAEKIRTEQEGATLSNILALSAVSLETFNEEREQEERSSLERTFNKVTGMAASQYRKVVNAKQDIKDAQIALTIRTLTADDYTKDEKNLLNSMFIRYYSSDKKEPAKKALRVSLARVQSEAATRIVEADLAKANAAAEAATE